MVLGMLGVCQCAELLPSTGFHCRLAIASVDSMPGFCHHRSLVTEVVVVVGSFGLPTCCRFSHVDPALSMLSVWLQRTLVSFIHFGCPLNDFLELGWVSASLGLA